MYLYGKETLLAFGSARARTRGAFGFSTAVGFTVAIGVVRNGAVISMVVMVAVGGAGSPDIAARKKHLVGTTWLQQNLVSELGLLREPQRFIAHINLQPLD